MKITAVFSKLNHFHLLPRTSTFWRYAVYIHTNRMVSDQSIIRLLLRPGAVDELTTHIFNFPLLLLAQFRHHHSLIY